jgi:hypothetical protein
MGRNRSFEKRAREEVERIKAEEAAEQERKQARMRELASKQGSAERPRSPRREGAMKSGTPSSNALRMRRPKARSG